MLRVLVNLIHKIVLCLALISFNLFAYTECPYKTTALYVGDDGFLWMLFTGGGSAFIKPEDPDLKNIYTTVLAAQMADKSIVVRYVADNVSCASGQRHDVQGVWLYK